MATTEQIRAAIDRYITTFSNNEPARWAECFTPDATQEDPVGTPANVGREAIEGFYRNTSEMVGGNLKLQVKGEPIIIGHEVAMALEAFSGTGADRVRIPLIIDLLTFDEDASITSLRAYWTLESMVPAPE
jgi:steroid delta-isomerase